MSQVTFQRNLEKYGFFKILLQNTSEEKRMAWKADTESEVKMKGLLLWKICSKILHNGAETQKK